MAQVLEQLKAAPAVPAPAPAKIPAGTPAGTTHDVSPNERIMLGQHMSVIAGSKAAIYDLQVQLEGARARLAAAEGAFSGVTAAITMAHGMINSAITPDLLKITSK